MNKWLAEIVGTFALVFAGTGAIVALGAVPVWKIVHRPEVTSHA